jgi:TolB-like protein
MKILTSLIFLGCVLLVSPRCVVAQANLEQHVDELSRQIVAKVSAKQKTTIAVVEFADLGGRVTNFGKFLAEELITRLHETEKFKVIERQLLNKIINEQKLSLTGVIDPNSAKKLGSLLGVDAIVSGSISDLGKSLRINARMISTETGEIFAVASTEVLKDDTVLSLLTETQRADSDLKDGSSGSDPKPSVQTADAKGLTFQLQACKRVASAVVCELNITSNDRERDYWLSTYESTNPSRLFDDSGNEFMATQVRLGNRVGEQVDAVLVAGIHTKATLRFEGISSQAKKISLLKVQGFIAGGGFVSVEFRDIPISK